MSSPDEQQDPPDFFQDLQYNEFFPFRGSGVPRYMQWDLGTTAAPHTPAPALVLAPMPLPVPAPTSGPAVVGVVLAREQEGERGEFTHGVIHMLEMERPVGRQRAIGRHLPPTPAPGPAQLTIPASAITPAATPPAAPPATPPAVTALVKLKKKEIKTIKTRARMNLHCTMLQMEVPYEKFKTPKAHEEMVTSMSHTRRLFKTYASHNILNALNLRLPPAERANVVQGYLSGLNFLHKVEMVDRIEVTHFLEADYLIDMIVDVVWQEGLYVDIDTERLDCVFGLAGAAVHNALKAYHEGTYEKVDASAEQFYDTYSSIIVLINRIRLDDVLRERLYVLTHFFMIAKSRVYFDAISTKMCRSSEHQRIPDLKSQLKAQDKKCSQLSGNGRHQGRSLNTSVIVTPRKFASCNQLAVTNALYIKNIYDIQEDSNALKFSTTFEVHKLANLLGNGGKDVRLSQDDQSIATCAE
ncbi:uncharacterized protein EDB93DRAFT_1105007 [Suillus bovinus]|uniref:uncharacterized protein n=1 Tax=Suillus bovinus TaxID=48563 RepID=UPI001B865189|nr:uncharacterized protein EDB93DRAFT_1105007 [Suillus bovinus]KAG2144094.1 hypothetical protein EDB93DRAFT_1105007 [Suillus bovinus]